MFFSRRIKKRFALKASKAKIFLAIGLVCLVLVGFNFTKELINKRKVDRQVNSLADQIASLERENSEISALIGEWQSGDKAEREARLKLGLRKPNESVVMIMRERATTSEANIIPSGAEIVGNVIKNQPHDASPNPILWWRYFFH